MIPIRLKSNVRLSDFSSQALLAVMVSWSIYAQSGAEEFVLTSVNDSVHGKNSLHGSGDAFDCRIWVLEEDVRQTVADEIGRSLGEDFDVILESDHIHIEYDPEI